MLIGISPLLGPELLFALRTMGHTDEIALLDRNCPVPADTRNLIRADGVELVPLLEAILRVLPLDEVVAYAVARSSKDDDPLVRMPVYDDIDVTCSRLVQRPVEALTNAAFGARLTRAHTIVATGEPRLYANVLLRKGVIHP